MEQPGKGQALVVDASALIAIYKREPEAGQVATLLDAYSVRWISALTVTEVLIHLLGLQLITAAAFRSDLETFEIRMVDVDFELAAVAAQVRHLYPLNLGDCFVYALAKRTGGAILTLDYDFRNCDVTVVMPT